MEKLIIIGIAVLLLSSWIKYYVEKIRNKKYELIHLADTIFDDLCNPAIFGFEYQYMGKPLMDSKLTKKEFIDKELTINKGFGKYVIMFWHAKTAFSEGKIYDPSIYIQIIRFDYFNDKNGMPDFKVIYRRKASIDEKMMDMNPEIKDKQQNCLCASKRLRPSRFQKA